MMHKITVLEDKEWIEADPSHRIKEPARWWARFFRSQGWRLTRPAEHKGILKKRTLRYGFFLIEKVRY